MKKTHSLWSEFPALQMVRTGRLVRWFGRATLVALVASVAAMFFLPWQQTARGIGVVVAIDPQQRPQPVLSAVKGVVSYVKPGLREGSYAEEGELLLRLTPFATDGLQQFDIQIAAMEAKRTAAESSKSVSEQAAALQESSGRSMAESLDQDYRAAEQKWKQSKNEEAAMQAELVDKRNQLKIAEEVAAKGIISREELVSKRQAAEAQYQKVLKAENAVEEAYSSLKSKEEEIVAKKREIDIKNRAASNKVLEEVSKLQSILKELSELQVKRGELDRLEIRAPRSGFIQELSSVEGSDSIKEGDQLFTIVPQTTELAVEMKIRGIDMPLVQEGDRVRLQFEGWPAVQFVGWPSVAVGTFGGKVNRVFPTDDSKGNFRVMVTPDNHFEREKGWPDDRYLRQGVRANGWVLLRTVSLGYEIWRQLNNFPPVISEDEPDKQDKAKKPKLPK
jgi:multidrug resistance efflux pump